MPDAVPTRLWLLTLWLLSPNLRGAEQLSLAFGSVEGSGLRAEALMLSLDWSDAGALRGRLSADKLSVAPWGDLGASALSCEHLRWEGLRLQCMEGRAELGLPGLTAVIVPVSWTYDAAQESLELRMDATGVSQGRLHARAQLGQAQWTVKLDSEALGLRPAAFLAAPFLPQAAGITGLATVHARLDGDLQGLRSLDATAAVTNLGLGQQEAIGAHAAFGLRRSRDGWDLSVQGRLDAGYFDLGPTVLAFPAEGLDVTLKGRWSPARRRLVLSELTLHHPGVAEVHGSLRLDLARTSPLGTLQIETTGAALGGLWSAYLQPWLGPRLPADSQASGTVDLRLALSAGQPRGRVVLHGVSLDAGSERYGLAMVDGTLRWEGEASPTSVDLRWQGGHLYGLELGPGALRATRQGEALRLAGPATLRVLDGELRIDELALRGLGTPRLAWDLNGTLTPISMEKLSKALGWPVMSGKLSGIIPALHYSQGLAVVDGALLARAFDGNIVVRNLRLDDAFGPLPRLQADVDVDKVDLDLLTRTFSFGSIQGRISGYVHGLEMVAWRPSAFDARLATPGDDESKHRISQKAVDSLTSLGGGIPGALSQGLLRAFDRFGYDRLGLSCRLERGVCHMDGVGPADHGYYIVTGGGLPRISVVGHAHRVDWEDLVARLVAATRSGGPVVQ